jgi:hypothetical protein
MRGKKKRPERVVALEKQPLQEVSRPGCFEKPQRVLAFEKIPLCDTVSWLLK